ncbi:hypothetical protein AALB16_13145 [Lachnospiraceae bacterium 62-35]
MRKRKCMTGIIFAMLIMGLNAPTAFAAGWTHSAKGWQYQWGDGSYCHDGWVHYKDHWYYFGGDSMMRTGWIRRDNTWYFAADSGELQGGIMKINGNVYYFGSGDCKMKTGNITYNGVSHEFTENGTTDGGPYIYTEWNSDGSIRRGVKFGPNKG